MRTKKGIFLILAKVLFAGTALWWLFQKIHLAQLGASILHANKELFLFGVVLGWITVFIAAWRWQQALKIFGVHIPLRSLYCITQIGQFFLIFLPGAAGDDLTRMLYITRFSAEKKGEACLSVIIDRALGLASILLIAVCCIPSQWKLLILSPQTHWLALGILFSGSIFIILGTIFFLFAHPTNYFFSHYLNLVPGNTFKEETIRITGLLADKKRNLLKILGAAIVTQVLICGMFYLAGRAVGIDISFLYWLSFVPIILAANAVPITIAGIGIREYLMTLFLFVLAHVSDEQALSASLVTFAMILPVCLLGGIFYIIFRPKTNTPHETN